MSQQLEQYLTTALKKLEMAYDKTISTQGYSQDSEKLKILIELIKEQSQNENISHTTSKIG